MKIEMASAVLPDGTMRVIDHELKTWEDAFQDIRADHKLHEFRRNDRGFQTGDLCLLHEFRPIPGEYTGEKELVEILAISYGPEWGIPEGFAVFSIRRIEGANLILPTKQ